MKHILDFLSELIDGGDIYLILLPVYVVLLGGERIVHGLRGFGSWDYRDSAANIAITLWFLLVDIVVGGLVPLAVVALLHEHLSLWTFEYTAIGWVLAFLAWDLCWYTDHRIAHSTGFFWAMHHVHHSSAEYNMTVASRGFLADETLLSRPLFYLLPIIGLTPFHFVVVRIVTNIWGIAQHTRVVDRLPVLDRIFATPSNHRVHHGSDPKYLDRNYGEVLIIWDHLFGSYTAEEEEPTYGVTEPIDTYNPVKIQIAGFRWLGQKMRRADGWLNKLRCLYRKPGWEPSAAQKKRRARRLNSPPEPDFVGAAREAQGRSATHPAESSA